jgi:hypothetical protein
MSSAVARALTDNPLTRQLLIRNCEKRKRKQRLSLVFPVYTVTMERVNVGGTWELCSRPALYWSWNLAFLFMRLLLYFVID